MTYFEIVNTLELLQIYMHVETKTIQLFKVFVLINYWKNSKGRVCTIMSFFLCSKTKTVIW